MDLGPGGGRIGERKYPPPQSHYWEVKNEEDAPPKPERGIMRKDSQGNTISEDVDVWTTPWGKKAARHLPTAISNSFS